MTVHVEWAGATSPVEVVAPLEFEDSYGTQNDEWCLLAGSDSIMAIEGSLDQLDDWADRVKAAVARARREADANA